MLNTAFRITNDTSEAEDAVQEAFISVFRNLESYRGDAAFGSWLKRIVINNALSAVRKRGEKLSSIDHQDTTEEVNSLDEDQLAYEVEQVKMAMQKLSAGYRVILSMYLFEGYDHSEIASVLSISESTSKTQYMRAKEKLKEYLLKSRN